MTEADRWSFDTRVRQTLEDLGEFAGMAAELVGRGYEQFMADRILQVAGEAVITRIGEAANRFPEEFRVEFNAIPWKLIIGMRNRLVHHYEATDPAQLWVALETSVPELAAQLGIDPCPDSAG